MISLTFISIRRELVKQRFLSPPPEMLTLRVWVGRGLHFSAAPVLPQQPERFCREAPIRRQARGQTDGLVWGPEPQGEGR